MKDRIVMQPGRVKLIPADGSAESIVFIERADTVVQEGTPLNKANLLADDTVELLGLEPDPDTGFPTPNDAFSHIAGRFEDNICEREEHFRRDASVYRNIYNGDHGIICGFGITADGTSPVLIGSGDLLLSNGNIVTSNAVYEVDTVIYAGCTHLQICVSAKSDGYAEFHISGHDRMPDMFDEEEAVEICVLELDESGYAVDIARQLKKLPSIAARLPCVYRNVTVTHAMFTADDTYPAYPYKAVVPVSGITQDHLCEVLLPLEVADSGNFSSVCESISGGIVLYVKTVPASDITIPIIKTEVIL